MKRHELLALIAIAIGMGAVASVSTFGLWTLGVWSAVLFVAAFVVDVRE